MEADRHYFFEGLFIIGLAIAVAVAFVWVARSGRSDDMLYRIHFVESVSGLVLGDAVKFHGVDVGTVKALELDTADPTRVRVDVSLRKDAPVKTDTKASLRLKGLTGAVYVELTGGGAEAKRLVEATAPGQIPEIASEKSQLTTLLESIPKMVETVTALGGQATRVMKDVGAVTNTMKSAAGDIKETTSKVKEDPSLLIWKKKKEPDKEPDKPGIPSRSNVN
jgi:phospholipid/cholesterol/gamma-HCH transport system substrate-binding protein